MRERKTIPKKRATARRARVPGNRGNQDSALELMDLVVAAAKSRDLPVGARGLKW